jgi:hypothetical protein
MRRITLATLWLTNARAAYWRDFVAMRAAIERLAATPAPDSRKLTAKANAIGGIWLGQRAPGTMAFAHRSSAMPCGWASRTRRRASPSASEVDNR